MAVSLSPVLTGNVILFGVIKLIVWTFGTEDTPDSQHVIEEAYTRYKRLMFATAGNFTTNIEDQKDIVQTALERLIRIFSSHGAVGRCISAGYIVFTIRSVSIDFLRKQGREAEHCVNMDDSQLAEIAVADTALENLLPSSDNAERLRRLWPKLPLEDRMLLEGKYVLGYADGDLATMLNCKASSIRMKLTRARRRAIQLLSERTQNEEA